MRSTHRHQYKATRSDAFLPKLSAQQAGNGCPKTMSYDQYILGTRSLFNQVIPPCLCIPGHTLYCRVSFAVPKAAIVDRKDVRIQAGREAAVDRNAERKGPSASVSVQEEDRRLALRCSADLILP